MILRIAVYKGFGCTVKLTVHLSFRTSPIPSSNVINQCGYIPIVIRPTDLKIILVFITLPDTVHHTIPSSNGRNVRNAKVPIFEVISHLDGVVNMEMVYIIRFAVMVKELA